MLVPNNLFYGNSGIRGSLCLQFSLQTNTPRTVCNGQLAEYLIEEQQQVNIQLHLQIKKIAL